MFVRVEIQDVIQIKPQDFEKTSIQAIEDNINEKYANKVIHKVGLVICFFDLVKASDGLIGNGTGLVNVVVSMRFFEDIWVPCPRGIPSPGGYDKGEKRWYWEADAGRLFYDNHEPVRFRIESEIWNDHTPTRPQMGGGETEEKKPPYMLIASLLESGLGPNVWWEDEEGEENDEQAAGEVEQNGQLAANGQGEQGDEQTTEE
ncbi:MAG: DNA-directed RNA polymerase III subunit rpc25 [Bogoriella megaspora]|nr:MAG: DNA-directed RNA polymerase III subunit rpc25 [Bogoriella megaspora]